MQVKLLDINELRPYENNPRVNDAAVDAVAQSIREFGFRQPLVVDQDGVIIVGHTRWKAARKLGLAKVPVHVATGLTPAQIKAYRMADNKLAELAQWDMDLLPVELADLQAMDFDLGLLGFDADELAKMLSPDGTPGLTDPDEVPEPPDAPVTQPGDLWLLGGKAVCPKCGKETRV
jgi:ParB-like chromosome segregation protein Spo0J